MPRAMSTDNTGHMIGVLVCNTCGAQATCATSAEEPVFVRDLFHPELRPENWLVEDRPGNRGFLVGPGAPRVACPDCRPEWAMREELAV